MITFILLLKIGLAAVPAPAVILEYSRYLLESLALAREQLHVAIVLSEHLLVPFCQGPLMKFAGFAQTPALIIVSQVSFNSHHRIESAFRHHYLLNMHTLLDSFGNADIVQKSIGNKCRKTHCAFLLSPVFPENIIQVVKSGIEHNLSYRKLLEKLSAMGVELNYMKGQYLKHWILFEALNSKSSQPLVNTDKLSKDLDSLFVIQVELLEVLYRKYRESDDSLDIISAMTELMLMTFITKPYHPVIKKTNILFLILAQVVLSKIDPYGWLSSNDSILYEYAPVRSLHAPLSPYSLHTHHTADYLCECCGTMLFKISQLGT